MQQRSGEGYRPEDAAAAAVTASMVESGKETSTAPAKLTKSAPRDRPAPCARLSFG